MAESKNPQKVHVCAPFADLLADYIRKQFSELEIVTCANKDELEHNVNDIEVLLCRRPPKDAPAKAHKIRWIMTVGAGVDTVLPNPELRKECMITNEALQNKTIAGAALDVFETEPLPPESPLWKMNNVIITPHTAGMRADYLEAVSNLFCENLRRYLAGQPLFNLVDRERGY